MKNYELYIGKKIENDTENKVEYKLIELDDKFDFSLIYNSSVFQEITSVKSNRTTTIKIPKTIGNLRAIEFSNIPENTNEPDYFPYRINEVKLYKNGLPIIEDGKGYVLAVSDYIEFFITWGVGFNIKELQNLKLRAMKIDDYFMLTTTDPDYFISPDTRNYGCAKAKVYQSHTGIFAAPVNVRFVSLKWVMSKTADCLSINIDIPDYIASLYDRIYMPMFELNLDPVINSVDDVIFGYKNKFVINVIKDDSGLIVGNSIMIRNDCNITFAGTLKFIPKDNYNPYKYIRLIYVYKNDTEESIVSFGMNDDMVFDKIKLIECKAGDIITVKFYVWINPAGFFQNCIESPEGTYTGTITMHITDVSLNTGDKYPIAVNLPDITAFDMLSTVTAMFGLFANYTDEDTVRLYSIDELYDKKAQAKNWTGKVITGNKIDSVSFSFGSFAKKNRLLYTKDDMVIMEADASLDVDSYALEEEKTLYEMKFAPSDNYLLTDESGDIFPIANFNLYTVNDDYTLTRNKLKDRLILIEYKTGLTNYENGAPFAVFPSELYFENLKTAYYSNYQKIILHPKVIEISLLLTDTDIFTLDLMIPVYLEQTGNYYIIIELQINGNNVAKAKLLQM
ncbi:MAG: hypothetical protein FWF53_06790 [Candidatus Azobacteroides sp.]|nr:hypothetical protein [Candidatus Azobacteroides sp.]